MRKVIGVLGFEVQYLDFISEPSLLSSQAYFFAWNARIILPRNIPMGYMIYIPIPRWIGLENDMYAQAHKVRLRYLWPCTAPQ